MNELKKIESSSQHICATKTAQRLWDEQIMMRKTYFEALLDQMQTTLDMEQNLMFGGMIE